MTEENKPKLSRRQFALRAVLTSAAASLAPAQLLDAQTPSPSASQSPPSPNTPTLSPESQAEAESRLQAILGQYGSRLSPEQKTDLRRLNLLAQPPLDRLRAYPTQNGDGSGLYLRPLMEREKKSARIPDLQKPAPAARNPKES